MSDTRTTCPSTCVLIRAGDDAWVAYECARLLGHDGDHRNGIASDAGSWSDQQAIDTWNLLLERLTHMDREALQAYKTARSVWRQVEREAREQVQRLDATHPGSTRPPSATEQPTGDAS